SSFESGDTPFLDQIIENSGVTCYRPGAAVRIRERAGGTLGRFDFRLRASYQIGWCCQYMGGFLTHTGRPEMRSYASGFFFLISPSTILYSNKRHSMAPLLSVIGLVVSRWMGLGRRIMAMSR